MALEYVTVGNQLTALEETPDSNINIDENGKCTAVMVFNIKRAQALLAALQITRHPQLQSLVRTTIRVQNQPPDWARVEIGFSGVVINSETEPGIRTTYSLQGSSGSEPIETHPDFADFGGTPPQGMKGTNDKGATFDETGRFVGFATQDTDKGIDYYGSSPEDNLAGVRSYLAPSVIYTEIKTYNGQARSSVNSSFPLLGKIDTPPSSPLLPSTPGGMNWLLISYEAEDIGTGTQVRRSWRLSGPNGWNPAIYSPSSI